MIDIGRFTFGSSSFCYWYVKNVNVQRWKYCLKELFDGHYRITPMSSNLLIQFDGTKTKYILVNKNFFH